MNCAERRIWQPCRAITMDSCDECFHRVPKLPIPANIYTWTRHALVSFSQALHVCCDRRENIHQEQTKGRQNTTDESVPTIQRSSRMRILHFSAFSLTSK